jgi:cytochrome P450
MLKHPNVQRKAQAELDSVVGSQRLPSLADRQHLPYVDAVVKEVMRCGSILPLGVPHKLTQDDVYDGYFLPKGSVVSANIWCEDNLNSPDGQLTMAQVHDARPPHI